MSTLNKDAVDFVDRLLSEDTASIDTRKRGDDIALFKKVTNVEKNVDQLAEKATEIYTDGLNMVFAVGDSLFFLDDTRFVENVSKDFTDKIHRADTIYFPEVE